MIDTKDLSEHAKQEPRQLQYELKRREFQAQNGRPVKRMERNR